MGAQSDSRGCRALDLGRTACGSRRREWLALWGAGLGACFTPLVTRRQIQGIEHSIEDPLNCVDEFAAERNGNPNLSVPGPIAIREFKPACVRLR